MAAITLFLFILKCLRLLYSDFKVKVKSVQKLELPEINDEFAKQLGAFDTLVALRQNLKDTVFQN